MAENKNVKINENPTDEEMILTDEMLDELSNNNEKPE
nr:MAG TPA: hypothetical protein [Caudoviricetes sp.]